MAKKMFKNLSLRQRTLLWLATKGYTTKVNHNCKYDVRTDGKYYAFIGSSGAIRMNNKLSATGSVSKTERWRLLIDTWSVEQDQLAMVELP